MKMCAEGKYLFFAEETKRRKIIGEMRVKKRPL